MPTISRRSFLQAALLSAITAAGGLAATALPNRSARTLRATPGALQQFEVGSDWERSWAELTAAAQAEGALSLLTVVGSGYGLLVDHFHQAFPGIAVTRLAESSERIWIDAVRRGSRGGATGFDLAIVQPGEAFRAGRAEGLWSPVRPLLFRPDVIDPGVWHIGFAERFIDAEASLSFAWEHQVYHAYAVDSNVVAEGEIQTVKDLLNPKWRGRIVSLDPRSGAGLLSAASVAKSRGVDIVRQLLVDQQPIFMRTGPTEITDALVQGRYAIALGVRPKALKPYRDVGAGQNIRFLDLPDADFVGPMALMRIASAPHPGAAQLFANWMLTQRVQTLLADGLATNSARTDTAQFAPDGTWTPGTAYFEPDREMHLQHVADTRRFVQAVLG